MKLLIEELAKAAVLTDSNDLPALIQLQEKFEQLRDEVTTTELSGLEQVADTAANLISGIVLREVDDDDFAISQVYKCIEYAQEVIEALDAGKPAENVRLPFTTDDEEIEAPSSLIDPELVNAWISECDSTLGELEATVVGIDNIDDTSEPIAEARRRIHTLKGECGVLSLHIAQKLCHDAETLIDDCIDNNLPFPTDDILALNDWMKKYVIALANNHSTSPPPYEELGQRLCDETASERLQKEVSNPNVFDESIAEGQPDVIFASPESTVIISPTTSAENESPKQPQAQLIEADDSPIEMPIGSSMDDNLNDFICEAREHLTNAEEALLELENDFEDVELINTVFRAFHTIKGVAGFMNLTPIVDLAHNAEFLLDKARSGDITLNSACLDLILNSCDLLSQLISGIEGTPLPTKQELAGLIFQLKQALDGSFDAPRVQPATTQPITPLGQILVDMQVVSSDQVEAALAKQKEGVDKLTDMLELANLQNVDSVEQAIIEGTEAGNLVKAMILDLGFATPEEFNAAIKARKESGQRIGQLLGLSTKDLAPALREQRRIKRGNEIETAGTTEQSATSTAPESQPEPPPQTSTAQPAPSQTTTNTAKQSKLKKRIEQTVKVSTTRMDSLVDMVGELVIAQQMVVQDDKIHEIQNQKTKRNLSHVGKIIRDLQEVAMSLRMVTVKGTFQKMARLVRDVAAKADKNIRFEMLGEDTELDRNVVEEIGDPLVHMIRNACDHGIETVEERKSAGKPDTGILQLSAYHQGGSIVIEIKDDGRGLNKEKILKKAIEKGIYTPDRELADIPDTEIFNLIFLPGFSTADKVTDISGRGVGMDVVRRNIEALRGKVEIQSKWGEGSTMLMRLPLTMAIIDGMILRVGTQRFVVPTLSIEQSFRPTKDQINTVVGKGEVVMVRGDLLPIHRLNQVFHTNEGSTSFEETHLIVLESNNQRCCLMVDEIIGQQQVVIKTLGEGINKIRGVSGGVILGDGRVALIIDVGGLVAEATQMDQHNLAA